jgi:phosphofructokinase-like protein
MANPVRRIGILTGGGDCPGLNAVIRAVAKAALNAGIEVSGIEDGYLGLIHNRIRLLGPDELSGILTVGGTILGSSNKANPAAHAVPQGDQWITRDMRGEVMEHCRQAGLDVLVVIGGDGTMTGAADLMERGLPIVGVPKTIDNDLVGTDITFGHDTAVQTAAEALDKVHTTASSHHRVMVVELMGRYAGWIALHAGVASGADVILMPEIPFHLEKVAAKCIERSRYGKRFTIIAAGEGAAPAGGHRFIERIDQSSPDPVRLGGVGKFVAHEVEKRTGLESRAMVLGYVQRGGTPTPHDRLLATEFGFHAFELIMKGRFGELVVRRDGKISTISIREVAGKIRTVPPDHILVRAARAIGTSFGD